jgi:hypothetical protein
LGIIILKLLGKGWEVDGSNQKLSNPSNTFETTWLYNPGLSQPHSHQSQPHSHQLSMATKLSQGHSGLAGPGKPVPVQQIRGKLGNQQKRKQTIQKVNQTHQQNEHILR